MFRRVEPPGELLLFVNVDNVQAVRKSNLDSSAFENKKEFKKEKRPLPGDGDSEDEPLASRIEKSKKLKKEDPKKKRKSEKSDDEQYQPVGLKCVLLLLARAFSTDR